MKKSVIDVYNKIAPWFDQMRSRTLSMEAKYLQKLTDLVPANAKILDLGCGTGRPIAAFLVEKGFQVTGVDGSEKMLDLAKLYVPQAVFHLQDMRSLNLDEKFDAIIMWHSSFHLSAEDQRPLFAILASHLKPGGVLMFTSGPEAGEASGENGGEDLYHASLSAEEYRSLLTLHHFEVISHTLEDVTAGGATVWLARCMPKR